MNRVNDENSVHIQCLCLGLCSWVVMRLGPMSGLEWSTVIQNR